MAFLDGLYGGGGGRRRMATTAKGAGAGRRRSSAAVAAPRPVRQLYWKLRSRLRSSSKRHDRSGTAAAARRRGSGTTFRATPGTSTTAASIDRLRPATASRLM
uniref:Uncharacterized protein n=1 Tax=Oryza rufipogon TaxID=4529 RepID=A0A0E0R071_ORYRU